MTTRRKFRLDLRPPFHVESLVDFLAAHVVAGVERVDGRTYARVLTLPHGHGVMALTLGDDRVDADIEADDARDVDAVVARARRVLDLDADPIAIGEVLGADPLLAPMLARHPGLRLPGQLDAFEVALRAVVGQQVSVVGAHTLLARFTQAYGVPVGLDLAAEHGLTHAFGTPEAFAAADETALSMPRSRARAVIGLATAVADGSLTLDPDVDPAQARRDLLALRGIGPWTADYVLMRGLGDPDVLLGSDLVIRRLIEQHGLTPERTAGWAPWRSYATMHLWRSYTHPDPGGAP